ncbi:barstar family protein [Streptomyces sp. VNUA116]|uniref:barstar family protein n=1 Tax=Streptomyces sp. VNUA116 TaxID=3062449 RepID=UPI002675A95B|nr:barstar family protein [Streptomyces sp. VNUA116]WKU45716.1 barstar family protein [Streptomyces sp. VNUA116]
MRFNYEISYAGPDDEEELWGRCVALAGLFREPVPPTREVLTLVGCAPAGPLADPGATRLEDMCVLVWDEERPVQYWGLTHVVVLARRPHAADPSLTDVVVEAVVEPDDGLYELPENPRFELSGGWPSVPYGTCMSVNGLFAERPEPPRYPMTLIGCEPEAPMLAALTDGEDEYLLIGALDREGRDMGGHSLYWRLEEARPSVLGGTLVDIVLADGVDEPPPPAARRAWEQWYEGGRPSVPNAWAKYPVEGRQAWLCFNRGPGFQHKGREHDRTGGTYHLDGRFVTDAEGLHCAMGEALTGPGGYFGYDWHSFKMHLEGGYGVGLPFTLVWHDADVARKALADVVHNPDNGLPYFEEVVGLMRQWGVTVVLE